MAATNFLKVEVILLLLLGAHIGDLRMGGLVPDTEKVVNNGAFPIPWKRFNLTDRLHTWCFSPGCTL